MKPFSYINYTCLEVIEATRADILFHKLVLEIPLEKSFRIILPSVKKNAFRLRNIDKRKIFP